MIKFKNKILMIGHGAVGRCTLPLLIKHISAPYKNITVIDFVDKREELGPWIKKGMKYFQERITPVNIASTLSRHVSPGGLVVDLAWNIESVSMLNWCHENKVLYVNTSVEEWDPYANIEKKTPYEKSLYYKQMEIWKLISRWDTDHKTTTAVLDHGANPGLISHFTKKGIIDIAERVLKDRAVAKKDEKILEHFIKEEKFPELSMKLGIKVIHISERDTQITDKPKQVDEFVGTWSIEGLREEGIAPAEIGWGTHENELPELANVPEVGPRNQIFLSRMGMNTWVRSWVPYGEVVGMVIRHAEAFTISDRLTMWRKGKAVYRPTVHYAYMPCNETLSSLYELRCRNYELQPRIRIMNDEIISGSDTLGALIMGHRYNSWWTGSMLSIGESRKLIKHQNATTLQVAIGVVSGIMWAIENPDRGVLEPDELPHEYILKIAKPYLGKLISEPSDWTPFKNYQVFFKENPNAYLDKKTPWAFKNFLSKP
ncbi:MAG: saccharopine dehydrogenase NADP-binding domain-containing protein [Candidatus Omnitrophica bacterium]|nr:saccharopine dehydrogenase NADP-binding domain-containing protein [Candidatus Omnitrophota bacterium]